MKNCLTCVNKFILWKMFSKNDSFMLAKCSL